MVEAIEQEMIENKDFFSPNTPSLDTLYFGGGTPSVCTAEHLDRLISRARSIWGNHSFQQEVTLESNPEDLTPQYLDSLKNIGVNRLSIGVQSFNADHLQLMNRHHSPKQVVESIHHARLAGFDNITIDLMYGLPFMTPEQWQYNIEQAIELGVEHISAYHLTIEPRTVFGKKSLQPVDDTISQLHFDTLRSMLLDAGYEHYEVSNFALPNRRAIHNSNYWQNKPYLGLGPSAHSYDGTTRRWNASANRPYLRGEGSEVENLSPEDKVNETIMTRLRTADGLNLSLIPTQFHGQILEIARKWSIKGYMIINETTTLAVSNSICSTYPDTNISIRPEYFLISDSIISDFFI